MVAWCINQKSWSLPPCPELNNIESNLHTTCQKISINYLHHYHHGLIFSTVNHLFVFNSLRRFLGFRGLHTRGPMLGDCTMSSECPSPMTALPIEKFLDAESSPVVTCWSTAFDGTRFLNLLESKLKSKHKSKLSHDELLLSSISLLIKVIFGIASVVGRQESRWISELAIGTS